jgi:protein gp37
LKQPAKLKGHQRVFVNSMSDIFHNRVEYEFIKDIWSVMLANPQHTFMILTKRADRMAETVDLLLRDGFGVLPNIWMGVSAENQQAADERIPYLLQTPVAVRFVSCEPLLEPVDFNLKKGSYVTNALTGSMTTAAEPMLGNKLDWVICGGESGPNARPMHPDWVRGLRDQCIYADVPFFFKQWGAWLPVSQSGNGWGAIPKNANITQIGSTQFAGVGKKAAGRLLDGKTWDEYPEMKEW